ncbi:MAG: polynucleotide adenylyltransferase [Clostridiales bacterium]|nr:polynucleotide adenylyltransferase [Clostridiales bacterium]
MVIPKNIWLLIDKLHQNGFEAYLVGGCIRDLVLGKEPEDWDICTSATIDEIKDCFKGFKVVNTGIKHGTLTVIHGEKLIEITAFKSLREDLSRRDFTINSLAYSKQTGLIDYFGGLEDIKRGIIRAVGDARKRFLEDPLRILRGVRFSAQLGFKIDEITEREMLKRKGLLQNVSIERITSEFNKILCQGKRTKDALNKYSEIIFEVIPEAKQMDIDDWNNTIKAICLIGDDIILNLTLFFHCLPSQKIMERMCYDKKTIKAVKTLIEYFDYKLETDRISIKRLLNKIGVENFRRLLKIKIAVMKSENLESANERLRTIIKTQELLEKIISSKECYSLRDLAINGDDLLSIGFKEGKMIGIVLNALLNKVIDEEVDNDKTQLIEAAKSYHIFL